MHKNLLVLIAVLDAQITEKPEENVDDISSSDSDLLLLFLSVLFGLISMSLDVCYYIDKKKVMKNMKLIKYFNIIIGYLYKV